MTTPGRDERPFLSGVILAAGGSVRMGLPKQILPLAGRPLLQHAIDAAAGARLDEIVLVLGHAAEAVRAAVTLPVSPPTRAILNPVWEEGQSTSLRSGLKATDPRAAAAAVLLGDQPGVTPLLVRRVAEAFFASGRLAARPIWRAGERRIPGHPVVLGRDAWAAMDALHGDEGARAVLAAHSDWLCEVAIDGEPPADIDDANDYLEAIDAVGRA